MSVQVLTEFFGEFNGETITRYLIKEENGISVGIINYGASITNIFVPDKNGELIDVVLGFTNLDGYIEAENIYMGSICGRYANRIANGKFTIYNEEFHLQKNDGENTLHGGNKGLDKVIWEANILASNNAVEFTYTSKNGEEGFPGNLIIRVRYSICKQALHIDYTATTDKATPVNLTSHCYFNLSGGKEENIFNHELKLNANRYLEVNSTSIPTGELLEVKNTDYDFTELKLIGDLHQLQCKYDHTWVINESQDKLVNVATLRYKESGIEMNVSSTAPGIHFYSGNFLNNNLINTKLPIGYQKFAGLCLEAQHFPDSPNQPSFPNTILKPGEEYSQKTIYSFTSN